MGEPSMTPAELPARLPASDPVAVYLNGLGKGSLRVQRAAIATMGRILGCPWDRLTYARATDVRAALVASGLNPSTVNRHLSALRGIARAAFRMGRMTADEYQRILEVPMLKRTRVKTGRAVPADELRLLVYAAAAQEPPELAARDVALLAVMYGAGLRRSEVAGLNLEDVADEGRRLIVRRAKSGDAVAHLGPGPAAALRRWLALRSSSDERAVFLSLRENWDRPAGGRLTSSGIRHTIGRLSAIAEVEVTPHDLRRTMISTMLALGNDLSIVKECARHANIATTASYDRRPEEAAAAAAASLPFPEVG